MEKSPRTIATTTYEKQIHLFAFNQEHNITSKDMSMDLQKLAENKDVKAVVIRVNSPGGSAYASEQIWHEIELLKAKEAIFNFADKNNAFDTESRPFFQERGLDLDDLRKKVGQELRKRYDSVPHFYFCANETDTPEGKARYDAQMKEYQNLKAKTNAHSLKDRSRSASYGESMRGFNWSTNELVDDNGELVCTVRFEVDSSD